MPRDGSGLYHTPAGTDGVPDTTIESAKYNVNVHDVENDLNHPRPIVAGGTAASTADDALTNLGAEKAAQVVTNFDSQLWMAGSFYAASTSTGSPVAGHAFSGVVYKNDASNWTVEARDLTDPDNPVYSRVQSGGTWGPWVKGYDLTDLDARFVNVTGDTMTGPLTVPNLTVQGTLTVAGPGDGTAIYYFGTGTSQYLSFDGTDYHLVGGTNFYINENIIGSGSISVAGNMSAAGNINSSATITAAGYLVANNAVWSQIAANQGTLYLGSSGAQYLTYNGSAYIMGSGPLTVNGNLTAAGAINSSTASNQGIYYFGSGGGQYLQYDGSEYNLIGAPLHLANSLMLWKPADGSSGVIYFGTSGAKYLNVDDSANGFYFSGAAVTAAGALNCGGAFSAAGPATIGGYVLSLGYQCRAGISGGPVSNHFNINWTGSAQLWVDATNLGTISTSSDYRIKKDVADMPSMWETAKRLHPITYTQAEFSPPSQAKDEAPLFPADDIQRWGFIAHELQDTLLPSAASGAKDDEHVQGLNLVPLVATLTRALQEAIARIEALEAK